MEIVSIFRLLWTRRLWVALGFALAVLVGLIATYNINLGWPPELESRQHRVGVASLEVLIDTPSSQVADLRPPKGADVLETRAQLFASLISTPPVQAIIARRVGIPANELTTSPSGAAPAVASPVAKHAPLTADRQNSYSLEVAAQETLPILVLTAEAPDARRAALLADQTFEALKEYISMTADQQDIPLDSRPVVTAFGSASPSDVLRGPGRIMGLAAALLAFGLVCVGIVVGAGLARSWREADALEEADASPADQLEQPSAASVDIPPPSLREGERSLRASNSAAAPEPDTMNPRAAVGDPLESFERARSRPRAREVRPGTTG